MDHHMVQKQIDWLERHGGIKISRKERKTNQNELILDQGWMYVDHRLDNAGHFDVAASTVSAAKLAPRVAERL
jgi:hypothetical protein